jgi:hypothetical protein
VSGKKDLLLLYNGPLLGDKMFHLLEKNVSVNNSGVEALTTLHGDLIISFRNNFDFFSKKKKKTFFFRPGAVVKSSPLGIGILRK